MDALGVEPGKDYKVTYSGKHDNSIMGVANKDYDAAPIASSVLDRYSHHSRNQWHDLDRRSSSRLEG